MTSNNNSLNRVVLPALGICAVVAAFYLPSFWLLPDPSPHRWDVWMLGYICGIAVMIIGRRIL